MKKISEELRKEYENALADAVADIMKKIDAKNALTDDENGVYLKERNNNDDGGIDLWSWVGNISVYNENEKLTQVWFGHGDITDKFYLEYSRGRDEIKTRIITLDEMADICASLQIVANKYPFADFSGSLSKKEKDERREITGNIPEINTTYFWNNIVEELNKRNVPAMTTEQKRFLKAKEQYNKELNDLLETVIATIGTSEEVDIDKCVSYPEYARHLTTASVTDLPSTHLEKDEKVNCEVAFYYSPDSKKCYIECRQYDTEKAQRTEKGYFESPLTWAKGCEVSLDKLTEFVNRFENLQHSFDARRVKELERGVEVEGYWYSENPLMKIMMDKYNLDKYGRKIKIDKGEER